MLLVSLEQSLGSRYIFGEVVGRDERAHVAQPRDQVAVVSQEAVQGVGALQLRATLLWEGDKGDENMLVGSGL